VAKRDEILTTALEVIARNGYSKTSIRELAAAVGLSQTGLLHYFGTKEELFIEILRKRDEVDAGTDAASIGAWEFDPEVDFIEGFIRIIRHNSEVPGLVQLYARFSSEAAEPGHPAREYFEERNAFFRKYVALAIRRQQDVGKIDPELDADRTAAIMLAASDGLQTEWMLNPSIDMADHISYLWERLVRPKR
jgi:AcrR family transcriptional regulator